jgi:hypothetical protein
MEHLEQLMTINLSTKICRHHGASEFTNIWALASRLLGYYAVSADYLSTKLTAL